MSCVAGARCCLLDAWLAMANWSELTFHPSPAAVAALRAHWSWKLGEHWTPILFSVIGDVFIELKAGTVWWLSTATGGLEQVADSREHFTDLLRGDRTEEWFLPGLVEVLHVQGKVPEADECYTYALFPVFADGSFSAENMRAIPAARHFVISGDLHRRIEGLPDGSAVDLESF
jgi:hypothetical protein